MYEERIPVRMFEDDREAARNVATRIGDIIREKSIAGETAVLGLATGHTPVNVYRELVRMHREEGLSFANVVTFNLDEYWPIYPDAVQSYHRWMNEYLFKHIDIPPENIHIPSGLWVETEIADRCREYEELIREVGGIDILLLGIGRNGHLGFNEPGSRRETRTRLATLDRVTRLDAASDFFGEGNVPESAISMGIGTILDSREIVLMAFGEHKADIIRRAVEEPPTDAVVASFLQEHPNATVVLDRPAASSLTRYNTPWLVTSCEWDDRLVRRAVIWLAREIDMPILKITDEHYQDHGLRGLTRLYGGAYHVNLQVFRRLMNTITGWPGGKEGARRVLILSPHPDDDVISMGGTMIRLAQQQHDVHVAYMTSGYLSVFDHLVARHANFVSGFNEIFGLIPEQTTIIEQHIDRFLTNKRPGEPDSREVREIKTLIRQTEAIDAATFCGISRSSIHFLNLPFYDTGIVQKDPVGERDVEIVLDLLRSIRPEIVFAAGEMSDPHGTHRQCFDAALAALRMYQDEGNNVPAVYLYRGAWQEWGPEDIDMAVPLSPDELLQKRFAVFRHESQKDRAMFPGPSDNREFWQRAEDRNIETALIYDDLGLPEYHAIEAFRRLESWQAV